MPRRGRETRVEYLEDEGVQVGRFAEDCRYLVENNFGAPNITAIWGPEFQGMIEVEELHKRGAPVWGGAEESLPLTT